MKKLFTMILMAVVFFAACTDENDPVVDQLVTIQASIANDSRVALDDTNETIVNWTAGDVINLTINGKQYPFTWKERTTFEYTGNETLPTLEQGAVITAFYAPAGEYESQTGLKADVGNYMVLSATETVRAGEGYKDLDFTFSHETSVLKLTISNDDFKGADVTGVKLKAGGTVVATATETFKGANTDGHIVVYFAIPSSAFNMQNVTLHAICASQEYTATMGDKALNEGKLYRVNKVLNPSNFVPMGTHTAAEAVKGDYVMADGTFISKDATLTDEQKTNVRGIVFWTTADMNPNLEAKTPAKLTDDKIMQADFPNCTHGLIVALKNVSDTETNWQSSHTLVADWQNNNFSAENKTDYRSIASIKNADTDDPMDHISGYQNTKILQAYNASLASNSPNTVLPASLLEIFTTNNPAPANTTGWFIPSVKEYTLLCGIDVDILGEFGKTTLEMINGIMASSGIVYTPITFAEWTSTERADCPNPGGEVYLVEDGYGPYVSNAGKSNNTCYVRAVCAF